MRSERGQKLNHLHRLLPEGLVVDAGWLEAKGYSSALRRRYLGSGWLEQPTRGLYRRPGGKLLWQHVVISLQCLLDRPVIVGGRTALELLGSAHYIAAEGPREVHLYGQEALPLWMGRLELGVAFRYHNSEKLFRNQPITRALTSGAWDLEQQAFTSHDPLNKSLGRLTWGQWDWPITLSTAERAILELLDEVPERESFHQADKLMEGLVALSPRRLQQLLEDCRNVKVKRLFLWFAQRHDFRWVHQIKEGRIDLGAGKRMLARGGKLDPKYLITVPRDLHGTA